MNNSLLNFAAIFLSFSTLTGVVLHATHLDQAVVANSTLANSHESLGKNVHFGDAHTHVERHSLARALNYQFASPGIPPRTDDKKHLMQRHIPKGHHAFDNYSLPLV